MRRIATTGLVGLGAFLIVAAALMRFYAYPALAKVPSEYDSVTDLEATGAQIFDAAALEPVTADLQITSHTFTTPDTDPPSDYTVWTNATTILRGDVDGATCATDERPGCFQQSSDVSPFEVVTGAAPADGECDGCPSTVDESSIEGDSFVTTPADVDRSGQIFKMPFQTEKKDYQWYDSAIGEATTMKYEGEQDIDGLTTYKFVQTIPEQRLPGDAGTQELPGSVFGVEDASVDAEVWYGMTRTLYVEPVTGSPVDRAEERNQFFRYDGQDVPAFVGTVGYTDDEVSSLVDDGKSNAFLLGGLHLLFPLVALLLGLALVVAGVLLGRNRSSGTPAGHSKRELVTA